MFKIPIYLFASFYFLLSKHQPETDIVIQSVKWFDIFGVAFIVLYPLYSHFLHTLKYGNHDFKSLPEWNLWVTKTATHYLCLSWALSRYGDHAYLSIKQNPEPAIALVVVLFLLLSIYRRNRIPDGERLKVLPAAYTARSKRAIAPATVSAEDVALIAAHEAGHAMLYGALPELPDGFEINVAEESIDGAPLGYVTGLLRDRALNDLVYIEWLMLMLLAGKQGEHFRHGEYSIGSISDHQKWLGLAQTYLSNHVGGIYYIDPETEMEIESNERKLMLLQERQIATIRHFFEVNEEVYRDLYRRLLQNRKMSKTDIYPLFKRLIFTEGVPRPTGEFSTYMEREPS